MSKIKEMWLVQPYQNGFADASEGPRSFETEDEAMACAKDFAAEVPYDDETAHECVVFQAIATYRGKTKVRKSEL